MVVQQIEHAGIIAGAQRFDDLRILKRKGGGDGGRAARGDKLKAGHRWAGLEDTAGAGVADSAGK